MPADFQVSDPAPAPMIGTESLSIPNPPPFPMAMPPQPMPGRADFPGAMAPPGQPQISAAGDYRSYAEPPPLAGPGMKSAEQAVSAAMRFQGMRGFSEDVAAGMPQEQAILKHGPKMFFNTPQSYTAAMKVFKPVAVDSGPINAVPVIHPETKLPIPGMVAVRGVGGAVHVEHVGGDVEKSRMEAEARRSDAKTLRDSIKVAEGNLGRPTGPNYAARKAELDQMKLDLHQIYHPGPGAASIPNASVTPIKVRRKSDGKTFTYHGDGVDVPIDKYELIPDLQ